MIANENALVIFKFGENRWINEIINGTLSFSCAEAFVTQAKKTDNEIQGDRYEGVFARLKPDDHRIPEMKHKLGNDLIVFQEGDYVLLRRKSAMLKPIFCFYQYTAKDALIDAEATVQIGRNTIRHDFDPQMFTGFSYGNCNISTVADERRFTTLSLYPNHFINRIKLAMIANNLSYVMKPVDYELQKEDEFFIEPTDKYNELFSKRNMYSYQHEGRICLTKIDFITLAERYSLDIKPLNENEYKKSHQPFYFELQADIARKP